MSTTHKLCINIETTILIVYLKDLFFFSAINLMNLLTTKKVILAIMNLNKYMSKALQDHTLLYPYNIKLK